MTAGVLVVLLPSGNKLQSSCSHREKTDVDADASVIYKYNIFLCNHKKQTKNTKQEQEQEQEKRVHVHAYISLHTGTWLKTKRNNQTTTKKHRQTEKTHRVAHAFVPALLDT